jgi:hypothetical protein
MTTTDRIQPPTDQFTTQQTTLLACHTAMDLQPHCMSSGSRHCCAGMDILPRGTSFVPRERGAPPPPCMLAPRPEPRDSSDDAAAWRGMRRGVASRPESPARERRGAWDQSPSFLLTSSCLVISTSQTMTRSKVTENASDKLQNSA